MSTPLQGTEGRTQDSRAGIRYRKPRRAATAASHLLPWKALFKIAPGVRGVAPAALDPFVVAGVAPAIPPTTPGLHIPAPTLPTVPSKELPGVLRLGTSVVSYATGLSDLPVATNIPIGVVADRSVVAPGAASLLPPPFVAAADLLAGAP